VKSKNVLLLTDAIHHLMQDLGLAVSPSPDQPAIDRLVRLPGTEVTFGLKILSDVTELKEDWPIQYHPGGVFQLERSAQ